MAGLVRFATGRSTRTLGCLCLLLLTLHQASSVPLAHAKSQQLLKTSGDSLAEKLADLLSKHGLEESFSNLTCSACKYVVKFLRDMFDKKMSFDAIAEAAAEVCYLAKIQDKNVCDGVTQTFKVGSKSSRS